MKKVKFLSIFAAFVLAATMVGCDGVVKVETENENSSSSSSSSEAEDSASESAAEPEKNEGSESEADQNAVSGDNAADETPVVSDIPEAAPVDEAESSELPDSKVSFKTGLWEGPDGFFYFSDGNSGTTSSYANKTGLAFAYEMDAYGTAVFHMGSSEDNQSASVTFAEDSAFILWDNGIEIRLNYLENYDINDLVNFFDDEMLISTAVDYYNKTTGNEATRAEISGENGLYAPISVYSGDELVAEYAVNRCTYVGTSFTTGENVSFINY